MEEVKSILTHYGFADSELVDYVDHSHHPDMWSHTFKVQDKRYVLVEVESVGVDLQDDEYSRLADDLSILRENLKLVTPRLEQLHTNTNQFGIGIDGHKGVIDQNEIEEYSNTYDEAQASSYFPPKTEDELPKYDKKEYKNPNGLDTGTTWVLFELI